MKIRRFTDADAPAVSELIRTTLRISNAKDYPPEMIEALIERETPEHVKQRASWTHFYVAENETGIIGSGAIGPYWDKQDESSLFTIFVHPDYQGKGVGRAIIETLEQDEFALRAKRIEIPASITGLPFYQKLGYTFKNGHSEMDAERLYRLEKYRIPEDQRILLKQILERRSYRGKYKNIKVPRAHLTAIMEAGLAAPSGCNKQTTSLIAVDDDKLLSELKSVIDPPVASTAPAMICVLTRRIIAYRDRCFAVQDYSAAIENMLLAIHALGYQSCWYEGHITDEDRIGYQMAQILGVPDEYELVCILPIGVAEEEPVKPRKKAFEERAWFNGFKNE
ncbi:MAG: GNAT family N-acetyltransferase [Firmicutes bacterium]|nr:GNAT family N-acetyltransferase [Bacillota bacterium]